MSIIYALLAATATVGALEALRPRHTNQEDEAVAFGGSIICGVCVALGTFLAIAVGT